MLTRATKYVQRPEGEVDNKSLIVTSAGGRSVVSPSHTLCKRLSFFQNFEVHRVRA
ncbi:hypothetical protein SCLCIDRAFT_451810 [Scleroderma citrinum Foug A]|uniref:Uncharacterized protein n=1 Tax=Scleroderma citrinum Foug A TaxID=1036808 RepID=A0A0C2ZKW4_9AGAM|nr:hypothetical protein SCLCIDRAFT_451810 [Scleroderma citrinum Foug A]